MRFSEMKKYFQVLGVHGNELEYVFKTLTESLAEGERLRQQRRNKVKRLLKETKED